MENLRKLIKKDALVSDQFYSDKFLKIFLTSGNSDPKSSLQLLKNYVSCKKEYPEFFWLPSDLIRMSQMSSTGDGPSSSLAVIWLPRKLPSGETIMIVNWSQWDPDQSDMSSILSSIFMCLEYYVLREENDLKTSHSTGIILIFDFWMFGWKHLKQFNVRSMVNLLNLIENCLPLKMVSLININTTGITDTVTALLKPFTEAKIRKKTLSIRQDNLRKLHQRIPEEYLPSDLGGCLHSFSSLSKECLKELLSHEDDIRNHWDKYQLTKSSKVDLSHKFSVTKKPEMKEKRRDSLAIQMIAADLNNNKKLNYHIVI